MRQAIGGAKREPSRSIFSPFCSRNSSDSVPQRGDDGMTELNWKRHCLRVLRTLCSVSRSVRAAHALQCTQLGVWIDDGGVKGRPQLQALIHRILPPATVS